MNSDSEITDSSMYTPTCSLTPGEVAVDLARRNSADADLALSRAEVLHRQAGDVARHVLDVVRTRGAERLFGTCADREWNVL